MILAHISAQGATEDMMQDLLRHLEFQAGLWAFVHRQQVQVQSLTIDTPPEQKLDEMVLG